MNMCIFIIVRGMYSLTLLLILSNANEYSEKEAIINTPGPLLVQAGAGRGNLFGGSEATQVTSLVTLGSDVTCDTALSYTCYTSISACFSSAIPSSV